MAFRVVLGKYFYQCRITCRTGLGVAHVTSQCSKYIVWKYSRVEQRQHQLPKFRLPMWPVWFLPATRLMDHPMRHFMHIGDQKLIGVQVFIDGNRVRLVPRIVSVITQLRDPPLPQLKCERLILPELDTVINRSSRQFWFQCLPQRCHYFFLNTSFIGTPSNSKCSLIRFSKNRS